MRSKILLGLVLATMLVAETTQAQQSAKYPNRQVRVVVPYPAGGPADLLARLLSQRLSERLGQNFYVENVGGAAGSIGTGQVSRATPDGHTLLVVTNDFSGSLVTNKSLSYHPISNFTPITIAATAPMVVAVNPSVPAKEINELVALIRSAPGKYSYATLPGLAALWSDRLFRIGFKLDEVVRVPFAGAAPAISSTLAGHTQITFMGLPAVASHLESGKLRALAVTSAERSPAYPDIPTLGELGYRDQVCELLIGVVTPAGTPPEIVEILQIQIVENLKLPETKSLLDTISFRAIGSSPAEYADQIKDDIAIWGHVMKVLDIAPN